MQTIRVENRITQQMILPFSLQQPRFASFAGEGGTLDWLVLRVIAHVMGAVKLDIFPKYVARNRNRNLVST
ncbi:hypothetical protein GJ496_011624 [Pomphorhynchus laevis]|nr:hypothetical protein GJ496_011624 [Pomphorhynchus laevis]